MGAEKNTSSKGWAPGGGSGAAAATATATAAGYGDGVAALAAPGAGVGGSVTLLTAQTIQALRGEHSLRQLQAMARIRGSEEHARLARTLYIQRGGGWLGCYIQKKLNTNNARILVRKACI